MGEWVGDGWVCGWVSGWVMGEWFEGVRRFVGFVVVVYSLLFLSSFSLGLFELFKKKYFVLLSFMTCNHNN